MKLRGISPALFTVLAMIASRALSQLPAQEKMSTVRLHLSITNANKHHVVPAVAWLEPMAGTDVLPFSSTGHYTLLQKNRTFVPHLQVVPVGSVVQFPNADPFFHNVFSLFDGKKFDLGLYEAGSSKAVTFSREGISYIFCNIHPEMSAVILSLSTPLYAFADKDGLIVLSKVPTGSYRLQLWIEGASQSQLSTLGREVHVTENATDLGEMSVSLGQLAQHDNKFGKPYDPVKTSRY